jgi:hypothetical protein
LQQIYRGGSRQLCVTHGYAFPYQIEEARKNPFVDVIESRTMAAQIGQLVKDWGFE